MHMKLISLRRTHGRDRLALSLALQGGGAHGAFTWGALDALLEAKRFDVEGVSATSAGAMNAVFLAQGMMEGGAEGARAALARLWRSVAEQAPVGAYSDDGRMAPGMKVLWHWTEWLSPQQFNPLDLNPLRAILMQHVDFDALRQRSPIKLFVAATHANSGKLRVFRQREMTADVVLASACLPMLHHPVHIDGEPYWDGGYSANPAVFPLIDECAADDLLLVLLAPLRYDSLPQTAAGIKARLRDLSFNSSFLREMGMLAALQAHRSRWSWLNRVRRTGLSAGRLGRLRFHAITAEGVQGQWAQESRAAVNPVFFERLMDDGRRQTQAWLQAGGREVGRAGSAALGEMFGLPQGRG